MKRIILLATVLLASCAPILGAVQGEDAATLTVVPAGQNSYGRVVFSDPDPRIARDTVIVMVGAADFAVDTAGLRAADPDARCYPRQQGWVCEVGDVDKGYTVPVRGKPLRGYASFYRDGDRLPKTIRFP